MMQSETEECQTGLLIRRILKFKSGCCDLPWGAARYGKGQGSKHSSKAIIV
jgi:hypothetical protein